MRVTYTSAASHVGVSTNGLKDMIARKVVPDPREVGLDTFRLAYIGHLRRVASGHVSAEGDLDLTGERARLAKEQADAQALKNAISRDEQVTGDSVDEYLYRLISAFVQRIRAIPPKAAPEVRATGSDAEGEALLAAFHDEALTELSEAGRRATDRIARRASREIGAELRRAAVDSPATAPADGERVVGSGEDAQPGEQRGAGTVANGAG